jgi:hypothetical protein
MKALSRLLTGRKALTLASPPVSARPRPQSQAKRHADALVIASAVGGDAFDRARRAYMLAHPRPFMRLLHAVLGGEWTGALAGCWDTANSVAALCCAGDDCLLA